MLKIKEQVELKELEKFGFKLGKELLNDELYKGLLPSYMNDWYIAMEFDIDEDTGKPVENEWGEMEPKISIYVRKDRLIIIDIMNNSCTYHNEGDDLEFLENTLYNLITAGVVVKE